MTDSRTSSDSARDGTLGEFVARVREFSDQRDWGQFHDPKNLTMALSAEVGELVAIFQWLTAEQARAVSGDATRWPKVEDEIADVLIYLVRLADVLGVDLLNVGAAKLSRNAERYPVELARGTATKYDEL
ncbi:nucleotide pyrophosphohydrolase [Geodermatophilus sp. CPCC 205506]|uniref:nucleotide pyrophosphohydrolase n=1 Tax=Geodermatophilus sp. CPCC 205506 TaxID=2936596 RepID=UPI003EEED9DE